MNGFQKLVKIFAICLAIFIIFNIFGWIIFGLSFLANIDGEFGKESSKVELAEGNSHAYIYTQEQVREINELEIDIKYASTYITKTSNPDITIQSNELKANLDVELINGKLKIREDDNWSWNKQMGTVRIYLPETMFLNELDIETGAGRLNMDGIYAKKFELNHGAGNLEISNSEFTRAEIKAGAGKSEIESCVLNNLKLKAGVRKNRT